jgi:hypothetical protein
LTTDWNQPGKSSERVGEIALAFFFWDKVGGA